MNGRWNIECYLIIMADRTGLEPATSGVTGRHSNQLNYRSEEQTTERRMLEAAGLYTSTGQIDIINLAGAGFLEY
jgi:hypothetical protein